MPDVDARLSPGGWTFSGYGPEFDGHVAAHLPGYMDSQRLVALVAQFYLPPGGVLADYGASTGRTLEVIRERLPDRPFTAYLYDQDETMLEQAGERDPDSRRIVRRFPSDMPLAHPPADLSLALWFLQFIPRKDHRTVLAEMRDGAAESGALLIATKTRHSDSRWQEVAVGALDDYKAEAGVDAEERASKTRSLRGAMHPLDVELLTYDLIAAGWEDPTLIWRWHVWSIIGAFAEG